MTREAFQIGNRKISADFFTKQTPNPGNSNPRPVWKASKPRARGKKNTEDTEASSGYNKLRESRDIFHMRSKKNRNDEYFVITVNPRSSSDSAFKSESPSAQVEDFSARTKYRRSSMDFEPRSKSFEKERSCEPRLRDLKPLMRKVPGYWVEAPNLAPTPTQKLDLERQEESYPWYTNVISPYEHVNFVAEDRVLGPLVISILIEDTIANNNSSSLLVLVRTKKEDIRESVTVRGTLQRDSSVVRRRKKNLLPSVYAILQAIGNQTKTKFDPRGLHKVKDEEKIIRTLLDFESTCLRSKFTFAVLYCKEGQTNEIEMFANEHGSQEFNEFLSFLGPRIKLAGFSEFSGGLDTSGKNLTGKETVYTKWRGMEFTFHVSTLLPYSIVDPQQLSRKRFHGNDIVTIIFKEGNTPINPNCVASTFNHVTIIVQHLQDPATSKTLYRVSVASKETVPKFGPELSGDSLFEKSEYFREFLFCKMVNAERAAYKGASFSQIVARTRFEQLADIAFSFSEI
eukprot:TRINITY_DN5155_c0_g1_i2.p1 TRINITY_DN5155_c0_g1~~TRINITY_DN5155_c0_g1_i2.p1  ORF type:complete len:513 (-),score=90.23 TRINITY_DN5155_c0_g1_i2:88-1626(-)